MLHNDQPRRDPVFKFKQGVLKLVPESEHPEELRLGITDDNTFYQPKTKLSDPRFNSHLGGGSTANITEQSLNSGTLGRGSLSSRHWIVDLRILFFHWQIFVIFEMK